MAISATEASSREIRRDIRRSCGREERQDYGGLRTVLVTLWAKVGTLRSRATATRRTANAQAVARPTPGVAERSDAPRPGAWERSTAPLIALLLDRIARARVSEASRDRAPVVFYERGREVLARLQTASASMLIIEGSDRDGRSTVPVVETVRTSYPALPVVAYVRPGRTTSADILVIAQLGVHELVIEGFDDVGAALRAVLASGTRRCATERVMRTLGPLLSPSVASFVRYCLERVAQEPSVTDAAHYLGVHRKTLVYRLRQSALPTPSVMIGWCRLFVAAQLLENPGRSVAQVALELDFASSSALRGMLRRYTGMRPGELRAQGGLDALLTRFLGTLNASRADTSGGVDVGS